VRFPHCAKLSKNWPTCQYTYEISLDEELLQGPGGGRAAWALKNGAIKRFYFGAAVPQWSVLERGAWVVDSLRPLHSSKDLRFFPSSATTSLDLRQCDA